MQKEKILVKDVPIRVQYVNNEQYISLTDIAKTEKPKPVYSIQNWMRNRTTIQFLGFWESLNNEKFKAIGFDGLFQKSGLNNFNISPKIWIEEANAIGMFQKTGRGGGTFAHVDIAIHFSNWLNVKFYTFFIREFRRLKEEESNLELRQWDLRRELTRASYEIHTEAIREHLSPPLDWNTKREIPLFSSEADLLNQAVFGMTAKEFKLFKPEFKGNLRDFATTEQLEVLNGLQHLNAGLIEQGLTQGERFQILYRRARKSKAVLEGNKAFERIKKKG